MSRRHALRLTVVMAVAVIAAVTALAVPASRESDAAYPGANGRIAYAYGENYGFGAIWSANSDGSAPTPLTNGASDRSPAYSPNGSRIAFEREAGVAVMNADGSGVTQLLSGGYSTSSKVKWASEYKNPEKPSETIPFVKITTYAEKWHGFNSPSFSPDGSRLAVGDSHGEWVVIVVCEVEEEEGSSCVFGYEGGYFHYEEECIDCEAHIVTVDAGTGAVTGEVTHPGEEMADYEPSYSPDGKIAFSRWVESSGYSIFVVNSPGAAPTRVTNGHEDYAPDFAPDGSRIAFSHSGEIALVGVGGGSVTILPVPLPSGAWGGYSETPAFSPDGSRIAFEHVIYPKIGTTERGVYTMGADGSGVTKIVDKASAPSWQPLAVPAPPLQTPPKAKPKKGKVKLDKKARAKVGSIVCGSSPCTLKILSAKLKAGKKRCAVKATVAKKLAAGKTAKVGVKVAGKCLAALKKTGKGRLTVKLQVTDALGRHVLTLKTTLVPRKEHRSRARG
jgi:dipeptidyl aminopeptidase/acylaminoacyl peptidase